MKVAGAKRVLRSLAVFGAVFLASGAGLGFAAAHQADDGPAAFSIAEPRPGDIATYEVRVEEAGATIPGLHLEVSGFEARWMPEAQVVDADGVEHAARTLATRLSYEYSVPYAGSYAYTLYQDVAFDAATGRAFRVTNHVPDVADGEEPVPGLPAGPALFAEPSVWWRYDEYQRLLGLCGFRTVLQDAPEALDRPVEVRGRCDDGNQTSTFYFRDAGADDVDGIPARRFVGLHDPGTQVWYHAFLPVPVRIRASLSELLPSALTAGLAFDLRLTGFERGDRPYPVAPPPTVGIPHRVEAAPRQPWGPDDAGVEHPFPLQEAYGLLLASDEAPFGHYLRETPGSYVASAWSWKWTDEYSHVHRGWWMLATDGQTYEAAGIGRHPQNVDLVTLPEDLGTYDSVWRWRDSDEIPDDVTGLYPPAGLAPARLATVASAQARYAELRDGRFAGLPAERYGFVALCADIHCRESIGLTGVGIYEEESSWGLSPGPRDLLEGNVDIYTMLSVDEDGRVRSHYRQTDEEPPFSGLLGVAPAGLPADTQDSEASPAAPLWVAPSAPATAVGGLVAAAAALLYYLWAAKGLSFLGLFTRIGDDEILDHPARRRVHDAIQAEPGVHFQELSRRLQMGHGVLDHHLQKLVGAGLVVKRQAPRYTCFFPKGAVDRRLMDAAPVLRSKGGRQVLEAIRTAPGANFRAVAARAGLSPSTVSYHVRRLKDAGLVEEAPVAGASALHLTGMGQQAVGVGV